MDIKENNIVTVCNEDKNFIQTIVSLSPEKKILIKGILIGMDLQEKPETITVR